MAGTMIEASCWIPGSWDLPMSYNAIVVALSSLKPFFFNGLKKELCFSDNAWSISPRNPIRAKINTTPALVRRGPAQEGAVSEGHLSAVRRVRVSASAHPWAASWQISAYDDAQRGDAPPCLLSLVEDDYGTYQHHV